MVDVETGSERADLQITLVKVDARVVKILAATDFGGDLAKIAVRGARYGFPGFESSEELKSGMTKRAYLRAGPGVAAAQQDRGASLPFERGSSLAGDLR